MNTSESSPHSHCRIFLRQLRLYCKIGVDAAEQDIKQYLLIDIDITPATASHNARPAVDYARVAKAIQALADDKHYALIENIADDIANMILANFAARAVRIYCRKPKPFAYLGEAGVEIIRGVD